MLRSTLNGKVSPLLLLSLWQHLVFCLCSLTFFRCWKGFYEDSLSTLIWFNSCFFGDKKNYLLPKALIFDMCDIRVAQSLVWQRLKTRTATVEAAAVAYLLVRALPRVCRQVFPYTRRTTPAAVSSASRISTSAWIAVATRKSCFSCNLWSCVRERCDKIPLLGNTTDHNHQQQRHGFCHHRWLIK